MTFDVAAEAYDLFMGRYSSRLSAQLADLARVSAGQRVLDVGCGPGALTAELVQRVGVPNVAAVDPSLPFVLAARERNPGVDVREASAESLPYASGAFDVTLAQLVVHFMADPVAGIREMARVTRRDGVVAACVWDVENHRSPLSLFWSAARALDRSVVTEATMPGTHEGQLGRLFRAAGLREVQEVELSADMEHPDFDDWWAPFERGVGPAGAYAAELDPAKRERLREQARSMLPSGPFTIVARAWAARGVV